MKNIVAIIPARGGSKGIPGKNIIDFCGSPLISWSIKQALNSESISSVWVSSDSDEILECSEKFGANSIVRPNSISGDLATSESAWMHAVEQIEQKEKVDIIVGLQVTSPLRSKNDIDLALKSYINNNFDSLFSVVEIEDFFMWSFDNDVKKPRSINYDFKNRKRRQDLSKKYLENGSIYVFNPKMLFETTNRIHGEIGLYIMEKYKMFQIDNHEDIELCQKIMKGYKLDNFV